MPPKKGVPWFATEKKQSSPFDKFMTDVKKTLDNKKGDRLVPLWPAYATLMDKPENEQFKEMRDASGKTAEDYGFDSYIASIRGAVDLDQPDWKYYKAMIEYLPEFKDRKDASGKTGVDYGFDKVKRMIDAREDKRKYSMLLKEHPEFFSMKDANGKTLLMYAAESNYVDAVVSMIQDGADVRIKDNEGKTVYQHAEETFNKELNHIAESYKNDPTQLAFEQEEVNDSKNYLLKFIKDAEAKLVARDIAPLAATSKSVSEIGGPIPSIGTVAEFLTTKKGDPAAQFKAAKEQLGKGRKTRRKSKKSKKSRRV